MTVTVSTVPDSVPFARVQELVRAFGFETGDLVGFSIDVHSVTAQVHSRRPDGKKFFSGQQGEETVATHTVTIPIVR